MKNKLYFLISVLAAILLNGCATRPVTTAEAVPVPRERIFSTNLLEPFEGSGTVIIKRDSGLGGSACSARLFVDAKPTADLRTAERVDLHLPVGDHILSAQPNGLCGGGMVEVPVRVVARQAATFSMGYGTAGDFTFTPTAF